MRRAAVARPFAANADDSVMGAAVRRTKTNAFAAFSEAHTANTNDFVMNAAARPSFEVRAKNRHDSGVKAIAREARANAFPLPEACAANASAIGTSARRTSANALSLFEARAEKKDGCIMGATGQEGIW